jgi:hypothetical protein
MSNRKKEKKNIQEFFFSLIRIFAEMVSELEGCNSGGFILVVQTELIFILADRPKLRDTPS